MYLLQEGEKNLPHRVQLLGSGTITHEMLSAVDLLKDDWNVAADIWSVTSFTMVAREGNDAERWNMMHPGETPRVPYATECLKSTAGPIIASTDYVRLFAEQIRAYIPEGRSYTVLGTDGVSAVRTRGQSAPFFEIDRYYVTLAALEALAKTGDIPAETVSEAIEKYRIDREKPNPVDM